MSTLAGLLKTRWGVSEILFLIVTGFIAHAEIFQEDIEDSVKFAARDG